MDLMDLSFDDASLPMDSIPPTTDVEYPCKNCGKEAGPYGGRGRKPTLCTDCKPNKSVSSGGQSRKITGSMASMAAQATKVLEQLNGIFAIGLMAVGYIETARAIAGENEAFCEKAHQALLTDPELCKLILKGGVNSGRIGLGIAYGSMGIGVAPVAMMEFKAKKEERTRVRMERESLL